ncbi:MAG: 5'-nucleotidase [Fibrobacterota bacterium]
MAHSLQGKLVVAVASSALFDLTDSDRVFREGGEEAYRAFQREREDDALAPGVAFPFIRRLLSLNGQDLSDRPVEVVLLSRNDPDTGARVFNSIAAHGLDIERAVFTKGKAPWRYVESFGASLFLSANPSDVREAVALGIPAGQVLSHGAVEDDISDPGLRIAFDFDGVLADDSSEKVYKKGGLEAFRASEEAHRTEPLDAGPLLGLFRELGGIQSLEAVRKRQNPSYEPRLRIAIATARGAPAHQRVVVSLRSWGLNVDEAFFLGGVAKQSVLGTFKPHLFFDDQLAHAEPTSRILPSVHVPFGIANQA